jgi:putative transposase
MKKTQSNCEDRVAADFSLRKERKHRLPLNIYKGKVKVTFTFCIEGKKILFDDKAIVNKFLEILIEIKNKCNCKNWVYIFMPDHVHLVMEGNSEEADLWKMVVRFKQKTGFWLSKNRKGIRWQKDFYDHIHRKNEDLRKHIIYILDNSVRKGLIDNWEEYAFKGSLDFDLEEIIT